jgi:hypothetical protein
VLSLGCDGKARAEDYRREADSADEDSDGTMTTAARFEDKGSGSCRVASGWKAWADGAALRDDVCAITLETFCWLASYLLLHGNIARELGAELSRLRTVCADGEG